MVHHTCQDYGIGPVVYVHQHAIAASCQESRACSAGVVLLDCRALIISNTSSVDMLDSVMSSDVRIIAITLRLCTLIEATELSV